MQKLIKRIICDDCIEVLGRVSEPFADLIFADPPFNIGYKYDKYHDEVASDKYIDWTREWMSACKKVLKPQGSFYIAIGDDYAANVKIIADELGLFMRNWIIWHYTFGQQMKNKFARAHTHIFYFVNDEKNFVFNDDAVRVISDRQKIYKDKRANPAGKMPDDVWDEYPRLCGTFDERMNFPCQMPESLLARIIRTSSKEDDWVLDPFSGSGTTVAVAHKLKRKYTGIEISKKYVQGTLKRLEQSEGYPIEGEGERKWSEHLDAELKWLYHENKIPSDRLATDPYLISLFTNKFNKRIGEYRNPFLPKDIQKHLVQLRKSAKLGPLRANIESLKGSNADSKGTL
ncbi:MAG: site-specific DNA-methyltransferase [Planctomycetota bacterium]